MSRISTSITAGLIAFLNVVVFASCANNAECDPGQKLEDGNCVPVLKPVVKPDGGTDDGGDGAAAPDPCEGKKAAAFGLTCKVDADCGCPASYCAVQPGMTSGYCSEIGCKEDASVCPADWGCLDLSMFQAGQPSVCTKPATP